MVGRLSLRPNCNVSAVIYIFTISDRLKSVISCSYLFLSVLFNCVSGLKVSIGEREPAESVSRELRDLTLTRITYVVRDGSIIIVTLVTALVTYYGPWLVTSIEYAVWRHRYQWTGRIRSNARASRFLSFFLSDRQVIRRVDLNFKGCACSMSRMIGRHAGYYRHNGKRRRFRSANVKIAGANSRAAFVLRRVY